MMTINDFRSACAGRKNFTHLTHLDTERAFENGLAYAYLVAAKYPASGVIETRKVYSRERVGAGFYTIARESKVLETVFESGLVHVHVHCEQIFGAAAADEFDDEDEEAKKKARPMPFVFVFFEICFNFTANQINYRNSKDVTATRLIVKSLAQYSFAAYKATLTSRNLYDDQPIRSCVCIVARIDGTIVNRVFVLWADANVLIYERASEQKALDSCAAREVHSFNLNTCLEDGKHKVVVYFEPFDVTVYYENLCIERSDRKNLDDARELL